MSTSEDSSPTGGAVFVVIPAYQEAASITGVVADVRGALPDSVVTVVDDGSTDDTAERARAAGARVLSLPFNLGVGGAMRTGFQLAVESDAAATVQVDADGQHPASEIRRILEPILADEADVVIGSRYSLESGYVTPHARRLGQRFFSALVKMLTGRVFTDTTSGFRAYGRDATDFLARNYSRDYPEVNALVALCHNRFRVVEVPVAMRDRQAGASHITLVRAIYYMLKVPLATLMSAARRREPGSRS